MKTFLQFGKPIPLRSWETLYTSCSGLVCSIPTEHLKKQRSCYYNSLTRPPAHKKFSILLLFSAKSFPNLSMELDRKDWFTFFLFHLLLDKSHYVFFVYHFTIFQFTSCRKREVTISPSLCSPVIREETILPTLSSLVMRKRPFYQLSVHLLWERDRFTRSQFTCYEKDTILPGLSSPVMRKKPFYKRSQFTCYEKETILPGLSSPVMRKRPFYKRSQFTCYEKETILPGLSSPVMKRKRPFYLDSVQLLWERETIFLVSVHLLQESDQFTCYYRAGALYSLELTSGKNCLNHLSASFP